MKSIAGFQKKTNELLKRAWVALGIPFDLPVINEKVEGIIDAEALIMGTLLMMTQDRIVTDMPAWLNRFSGLINHQKLKTMAKTISRDHRTDILENLDKTVFSGAPKGFRAIFNLKKPLTNSVSKTMDMRLQKLNTVENVAHQSIMIHNRLLFGTGFRADLISLTLMEGLRMKGTQLAELLCTNSSTVSRILKDLRACGFLDQDNERLGRVESYPGMFISTRSVFNLWEMIDATKFSFEKLKQDAFENLNLKHDGFGRKILEELV